MYMEQLKMMLKQFSLTLLSYMLLIALGALVGSALMWIPNVAEVTATYLPLPLDASMVLALVLVKIIKG